MGKLGIFLCKCPGISNPISYVNILPDRVKNVYPLSLKVHAAIRIHPLYLLITFYYAKKKIDKGAVSLQLGESGIEKGSLFY